VAGRGHSVVGVEVTVKAGAAVCVAVAGAAGRDVDDGATLVGVGGRDVAVADALAITGAGVAVAALGAGETMNGLEPAPPIT
jgi:hypothetical protein